MSCPRSYSFRCLRATKPKSSWCWRLGRLCGEEQVAGIWLDSSWICYALQSCSPSFSSLDDVTVHARSADPEGSSGESCREEVRKESPSQHHTHKSPTSKRRKLGRYPQRCTHSEREQTIDSLRYVLSLHFIPGQTELHRGGAVLKVTELISKARVKAHTGCLQRFFV